MGWVVEGLVADLLDASSTIRKKTMRSSGSGTACR
jgi:hypothetical protein